MLITYGFGVKTSSGYGTAQNDLANGSKLALRLLLPDQENSTQIKTEINKQMTSLPRYLISPNQLHPDFCQPDGSIKSESEYQAMLGKRGQDYTKKDKQLYTKAKKWWERERQKTLEQKAQGSEPVTSQTQQKKSPISERTFNSLSEMLRLTQRIAAQLQGGDAG